VEMGRVLHFQRWKWVGFGSTFSKVEMGRVWPFQRWKWVGLAPPFQRWKWVGFGLFKGGNG